jgi:hypothetical protein
MGPLGGIAVAGLGKAFGIDAPTTEKLTKAIQGGQITPEALAEIKKLEMEYQDHEKERGFKYAELEFKDRDSARQANVQGGTQSKLFWLSLVVLSVAVGTEVSVLFHGYAKDAVDPVLVGRILGLLDAVAIQVLGYWYGSSSGSHQKTEIMASK